jgi:arginase
MGAGPDHLIEQGLATHFDASVQVLETTRDELTAAFDLARQIGAAVRAASDADRFPVILAGNCLSTLGGLAGLHEPPALLWLDAHADFNTPDTSESGFLDGMALSIITGACYRNQFTPLPIENVVMLGVRSIDAGERSALEGVKLVRSSRELWSALAAIPGETAYLHVDLDVMDPSVLRANHFAAPYGLSLHTLHDAIVTLKANKRIAALALTAYDPTADEANQALPLALDIITRVTSEEE